MSSRSTRNSCSYRVHANTSITTPQQHYSNILRNNDISNSIRKILSSQTTTNNISQTQIKFTIDSGAEITAVRIEELTANQQQAINTTERITATMPNGTNITAIGTIPISISPHVHTTAHVFKKGELAKSLLAAADITNNGCKINCHGLPDLSATKS